MSLQDKEDVSDEPEEVEETLPTVHKTQVTQPPQNLQQQSPLKKVAVDTVQRGNVNNKGSTVKDYYNDLVDIGFFM